MSELSSVDIGLIERLRDEAALCRSETAVDVAELLEEAVDALTAREEQVRAKLEDCHRECCNDFPKGSVYMHGAMDAFMAIGVLTEEQRRLWNLAMKTCPGHDSPRAWCAYCGNVKEESHD